MIARSMFTGSFARKRVYRVTLSTGTVDRLTAQLRDSVVRPRLQPRSFGGVSLRTASFASASIRTGVFRRGNPILDPVTHETLRYERTPSRASSPL